MWRGGKKRLDPPEPHELRVEEKKKRKEGRKSKGGREEERKEKRKEGRSDYSIKKYVLIC